MAFLQQLQGLIGISAILLMAWGLSEQRKAFPGWRWVGGAFAPSPDRIGDRARAVCLGCHYARQLRRGGD